MSSGPWLTIYTYLMPVLAGLSLLTVICRVVTIWQKERTRRAIAFGLVYVSLFVLFLLFSLYARMTPLVPVEFFLPVTTGGYVLLALAMALGNYYEWSDLVAFLRRKDAAHVEHVEHDAGEVHTLKSLGDVDATVVLEASVVAPESVGSGEKK